MRIVFTGGATGGHFYPIIAVAEDILAEARDRNLLEPNLHYLAPTPYDEQTLFDLGIAYHRIPAGKWRRYFSLANITDLFKTAAGIIGAVWLVYRLYPDIIFSKGGYASFPVVFAARIFGIPLVIHESDAVPGAANAWAGKFAKHIAVSYPGAAEHFPKEKVALTGNPVRDGIQQPEKSGAHAFLELPEEVPVVFILGGSQGAQRINNTVLEALPYLLEDFSVIHQTGEAHIEEVKGIAHVATTDAQRLRYKPFGYLNDLAMRMSAGAADIIISRAGSTIYEIALWGIPSIIIPITKSGGDHQRRNAFAYARSGAAIVIEEENLTPNILISEIRRLMNDPQQREQMAAAALDFAKPDAAATIAAAILDIGLTHES